MTVAWAKRMLVPLVEAHLLAVLVLDVHLWRHSPGMLVFDIAMLFMFLDDVDLTEFAAVCLFLYIDPLGVARHK